MRPPNIPTSWLLAFRTYLAASAILHLGWEVLQLPLYTIWRAGTVKEMIVAVLHCTAGDLMIASLAILTALLIVGDRAWPSQRFVPVFAATLMIGIAYTVYSEWLNTIVRSSWAYSPLMPTVPWLGTGLSPLLQWLVVPAVGFEAIRRFGGMSTGRNSGDVPTV